MIKNRKASSLHTGLKVGSTECHEKFLGKHKEVIKDLKLGRSYKEINKLTVPLPKPSLR